MPNLDFDVRCDSCGWLGLTTLLPSGNEEWFCPNCGHDASAFVYSNVVGGAVPVPSGIDKNQPSDQDRRMLIQELQTDPDLIEIAEEMAEKIKAIVYGNHDEWEDRIDNIVVDHYPPEIVDQDADEGAYLRAVQEVVTVLHWHLRPMLDRIFTTGDWQVPQLPTPDTINNIKEMLK